MSSKFLSNKFVKSLSNKFKDIGEVTDVVMTSIPIAILSGVAGTGLIALSENYNVHYIYPCLINGLITGALSEYLLRGHNIDKQFSIGKFFNKAFAATISNFITLDNVNSIFNEPLFTTMESLIAKGIFFMPITAITHIGISVIKDREIKRSFNNLI